MRAREAAFRAELEATAAEIGAGERVLRANYRPRGLVFLVAAGLFAAASLALFLFGAPGSCRRATQGSSPPWPSASPS